MGLMCVRPHLSKARGLPTITSPKLSAQGENFEPQLFCTVACACQRSSTNKHPGNYWHGYASFLRSAAKHWHGSATSRLRAAANHRHCVASPFVRHIWRRYASYAMPSYRTYSLGLNCSCGPVPVQCLGFWFRFGVYAVRI